MTLSDSTVTSNMNHALTSKITECAIVQLAGIGHAQLSIVHFKAAMRSTECTGTKFIALKSAHGIFNKKLHIIISMGCCEIVCDSYPIYINEQ